MKIYNWFSEMGYRIVLLYKRGPKYLTLVTIEADGLRLVKIPVRDEKYLREAGKSTKAAWKRCAKKPGTKKGAKKALKEMLAA